MNDDFDNSKTDKEMLDKIMSDKHPKHREFEADLDREFGREPSPIYSCHECQTEINPNFAIWIQTEVNQSYPDGALEAVPYCDSCVEADPQLKRIYESTPTHPPCDFCGMTICTPLTKIVDGMGVDQPYCTEVQREMERQNHYLSLFERGYLVHGCGSCQEFIDAFKAGKDVRMVHAPMHKKLYKCDSGGRPHCTCDQCF